MWWSEGVEEVDFTASIKAARSSISDGVAVAYGEPRWCTVVAGSLYKVSQSCDYTRLVVADIKLVLGVVAGRVGWLKKDVSLVAFTSTHFSIPKEEKKIKPHVAWRRFHCIAKSYLAKGPPPSALLRLREDAYGVMSSRNDALGGVFAEGEAWFEVLESRRRHQPSVPQLLCGKGRPAV